MPKISILIPYYNDEEFLKESIQSVLNQAYSDFELVLINHACTDKSREIAHSFADARIKHVDLPRNEGAGGGIILEAFLNIATGTFIKFFSADDVMKQNCLEVEMTYLEKNPQIDFCFADAECIDDRSKKTGVIFSTERSKCLFTSPNIGITILEEYYYHWANNVPYPTLLFRRHCFDVITIDFSFVMLFDVRLILEMLLANMRVGCIKEVVCQYRIHKEQVSSTSKWPQVRNYSYFEGIIEFSIFLRTNNIKILQQLVRSRETDIDFLRLAVAQFFLTDGSILPRQIAGYLFLHDFLNSAEGRRKAEQIGLTIGRFRYFLRTNPNIVRFYKNEINNIGIKGVLRVLLSKIKHKIIKQKLGHF